MTSQVDPLGSNVGSPFITDNGAQETSRHIPRGSFDSPVTGAYDATGTTPVPNVRPIQYHSLTLYFSTQSATGYGQIATSSNGSGGVNGPTETLTGTYVWNYASSTPLQYAVNAVNEAGTSLTYYYGFGKADGLQATFRRGATPNASYNPNGIYETAAGTTTTAYASNTIYGSVTWLHVPNAPTFGVGQGATSTTPGQADLTWTAPSDNGGSAVYGYRIIYKKSSASAWSVYGNHTIGSPSNTTGTSATVTGLDPGVSYDFKVAAMNIVSDRHLGASIYPTETRDFGNYSSITAPIGTNSATTTVVVASLPAANAPMKVNTTAGAAMTLANAGPKVYNGSSWANASAWVYNGSAWDRKFEATGGQVTTYTSGGITYRVHTFNVSGTFTVSAGCYANVTYLIVAGGGSGGGSVGGGGGAGGLLTGTYAVSPGSYSIVVGTGGAQQNSEVGGVPGGNSSAFGLTATGGGGGASSRSGLAGIAADTGGSGGGGSQYSGSTGAGTGAAGTAGQGYAGGNCAVAGYGPGGGGGAGAVGSNGAASYVAGAGGIGVQSSITGTATYYAGGGGGAGSAAGGQGAGGSGGGGAGGVTTTRGTAGTNGLGGGGGGGWSYAGGSSGQGGSGVVIVRYEIKRT